MPCTGANSGRLLRQPLAPFHARQTGVPLALGRWRAELGGVLDALIAEPPTPVRLGLEAEVCDELEKDAVPRPEKELLRGH